MPARPALLRVLVRMLARNMLVSGKSAVYTTESYVSCFTLSSALQIDRDSPYQQLP